MEPKRRYKTVDEYIAAFPENVQGVLQKLRQTVREAAPEAVEVISYGMPAYRQNGVLVWFAAHKNHIGFYPYAATIEAFRKQLAKYETSKGTIKFPLDQPVPFELVGEMVKFRVKENLHKKSK